MNDNREILEAWFQHCEKYNLKVLSLFAVSSTNSLTIIKVDEFHPENLILACEETAKIYREKFNITTNVK